VSRRGWRGEGRFEPVITGGARHGPGAARRIRRAAAAGAGAVTAPTTVRRDHVTAGLYAVAGRCVRDWRDGCASAYRQFVLGSVWAGSERARRAVACAPPVAPSLAPACSIKPPSVGDAGIAERSRGKRSRAVPASRSTKWL
jgi:hypothetical protein